MADKNYKSYVYHPAILGQPRLGFKFGQRYPAGFGNLTGSRHLGQDYLVPIGTPVYAIAGGRTKSSKVPQGGNMVTLTTNNALSVRYMHLDRFVNASNGLVNKGDLIGYSGNTGISNSGGHLHIDIYNGLETNINNFYKFIDPLTLTYQLKEEDMTTKEIRAIVEGIYWSFGMRQPDKGGVDTWVSEYSREPEKAKWLNRILEGLRKEKSDQGIGFLDAKENRWRSKDDIKGK